MKVELFRRSRSQFLAALRFGTLFALGAVLLLAGGMTVIWRTMKSETDAFVQQSIGDSATLVASHASVQVERLTKQLQGVAKRELRSFLAKQDFAADPKSKEAQAILNEPPVPIDADILDAALWTRETPEMPPLRVQVGINPTWVSPPGFEHNLKMSEASEPALVAPAFAGQTVFVGVKTVSNQGMILVAIPIEGVNEAVLSVHLSSDRLQKVFRTESMVRAALVDRAGLVIAHPDASKLFTPMPDSPLLTALRTGTMKVGQLVYDSGGAAFFGGYQRITIGELGVVASIPETEARSGLAAMREQALVIIGLAFVFCFVAGFAIAIRRPAAPAPGTSPAPVSNEPSASGAVTIIHGSIRGLAAFIDAAGPEHVVDAISDFLTLVANRVRERGGRFERADGASFCAYWNGKDVAPAEAMQALRCAIELRQDLSALNESRKVDGHRALLVGMGVYSGQAVYGRMGSADAMSFTVAGTPLTCARALDDLSPGAGVDVLVAQETWQFHETQLIGEILGEVRLTPDTGLTTYHTLAGYRDETGAEVRVETPYSRTEVSTTSAAPAAVVRREGPKRWLVNNGSQIVGPFTPEQISACLFAQEMDFDSECWAEGTGQTAKLGESGIFSGSEDEGATLWVYDGKIIHGPLSQGFLATAVSRGAIPEDARVCEGSTVSGWTPLAAWREAHPDAMAAATGATAPAASQKSAA